MIEGVKFGVLLSRSIRDRESGRSILQTLEPHYSPQKFNTYEPINLPYSKEEIDGALEHWGSHFFWRRKPKILGAAWGGGEAHSSHDSITIDMPMKYFREAEIDRLLGDFAASFGIDFAYVHVDTKEDTDNLNYYATHLSDFSNGLTTHQLREGIPSLCWLTLLGEPYKKLFEDRLSSVPAYSVKDVGGATCIQLTEDIRDVDKKREEYEAAKKAAIDHLDSDAFRVMGVRKKYRVPEFKL